MVEKKNDNDEIKEEKQEKLNHIEDNSIAKTKVSSEERLENDVVRAFDEILEDNEKIIKALKPNKAKIFWSNIIKLALPFLFLLAFSLLVVAIPEEGATVQPMDFLYVSIAVVGLFIVFLAFNLWFTALYYKNTIFAYTNKRLIIRTGIFGVDYKSLDIKNIGASDVYVSLLDKILRKGTGSLRFGSNSSPIYNNAGAGAYTFANISEPYVLYKEIKSHIEKVQKEKQ